MGTKCKSERASRAGSQSLIRCFSSSRGFSDRDEACLEDAGADPLDFDFCGSIKDVTEPRLPLTQKKRLVPYYGNHRDKESLLEDLKLLLNAFQDQKFHFRFHKMHHEAVEAVNRKLVNQIEHLETSGLEAARSGTLTKLKSKLKGAKFRLMETQMTCAANSVEVERLRSDAQVMKTQPIIKNHIRHCTNILEVYVQRDEYATEVRRLQKTFRKLRILNKKVLVDNSEVARLKEDLSTLTAKNIKLEASVAGMSKKITDMTTEMAEWKAKRVAAQYARAADDQRFLSLEDDNKSLIDLLFTEKLAQESLTTTVNELGRQVRLVERETRERATMESETALTSAG